MAEVISQTRMNRHLAHMPGVRRSVKQQANKIAKAGKARLARHRQDGNAYVEVTHASVDSIVWLVDPISVGKKTGRGKNAKRGAVRSGNAMAIEFGHNIVRNGKIVGRAQGLYIITGPALGLR